jgi:twinkle protein
VFCDFATGDRGDLLDLWRLTRQINLMAALSEATQWLGIASPSFVAHKPLKHQKPDSRKVAGLAFTVEARNYLVQERRLSEATLTAFKIASHGKDIIFPYYRDGELINVKYLSLLRPNGKKQIRVEANCEPCLFGWQSLPSDAREVALCEGEIDAMTLSQYGFPALSVPFGGGGGAKQQWVEYEFERLAMFDKIYLCLDGDQEGQIATAELIERLGRHRCFVVKLPHKDANACLQAGVSQEVIQVCFNQAQSLDPSELKPASLFVQQVIDEFYPQNDVVPGIHPPWDKARNKILFRPDELSILELIKPEPLQPALCLRWTI